MRLAQGHPHIRGWHHRVGSPALSLPRTGTQPSGAPRLRHPRLFGGLCSRKLHPRMLSPSQLGSTLPPLPNPKGETDLFDTFEWLNTQSKDLTL